MTDCLSLPSAEEASIYFRLPSNCIWFKGGCISEDKEEEEAEPPGDCVLSLFAAGILKKATFTYLYLINECYGPNWPGSSSQWVSELVLLLRETTNNVSVVFRNSLETFMLMKSGQMNAIQSTPDRHCAFKRMSLVSTPDWLSLSLFLFIWSWCAADDSLLPDWLDCCGRALFNVLSQCAGVVLVVALHVTVRHPSMVLLPSTFLWVCIQVKHVSLRTHRHRKDGWDGSWSGTQTRVLLPSWMELLYIGGGMNQKRQMHGRQPASRMNLDAGWFVYFSGMAKRIRSHYIKGIAAGRINVEGNDEGWGRRYMKVLTACRERCTKYTRGRHSTEE